MSKTHFEQDPSLTRGRELLQQKRGREAVELYERRITELSAQCGCPSIWHIILNGVVIGLTIVAVLGLAPYAEDRLSDRGSKDAEYDWWREAKPVIEAFLGTAQIAHSTPRGQIGPAMLDLQRHRQAFRDLNPPSSAQTTANVIEDGMNAVIDAFMSFARDSSDQGSKLLDAELAWGRASRAVEDIGFDMPQNP